MRGRQIVRQWMILRALEASRTGLTVAAIHAQVEEECSLRTIYRDLEQLEQAGFPLLDEDGRWRVLQTGEGAWSIPFEPSHLLALAVGEELLAPAARSSLVRKTAREVAATPPAERRGVARTKKHFFIGTDTNS